jgi:CheY-like chemotaxis protein
MSRPRKVVLCVESDLRERCALIMLLETRGMFRAFGCSTGLEALRVLEGGHRVDLVVANLDLPGMGGNEFCRRVRMRFREARLILIARREAMFSEANHANWFLEGEQLTSSSLLEACRVVASRKRGPRKAAEAAAQEVVA